MPKAKNQKNPVSEKSMALLGIVCILGLIFIISGIYAIIAISLFLGVTLIVIGVITYVLFVVVEKRLKLL
jgi:uncharacterized membrane protein HdeD (DUF308 family)